MLTLQGHLITIAREMSPFGRHDVLADSSQSRSRTKTHHLTISLSHRMGQVALEGMEFFAFHGYYDEEQKIGNKYSVDLYVETDLHDAAASDELAATVNYVELYRIVAEEMKVSARLLEHVGHRILDGVLTAFPQVKSVKVAVSKYNPPFGGICYRSRVTLKRKQGKA